MWQRAHIHASIRGNGQKVKRVSRLHKRKRDLNEVVEGRMLPPSVDTEVVSLVMRDKEESRLWEGKSHLSDAYTSYVEITPWRGCTL